MKHPVMYVDSPKSVQNLNPRIHIYVYIYTVLPLFEEAKFMALLGCPSIKSTMVVSQTILEFLFWTRSKGWFIRILRRVEKSIVEVRWIIFPWCLHSIHQVISIPLDAPPSRFYHPGNGNCLEKWWFSRQNFLVWCISPHVFGGFFFARPRGETVMVPTWRRPKQETGSDGGDFWSFLISKSTWNHRVLGEKSLNCNLPRWCQMFWRDGLKWGNCKNCSLLIRHGGN